MSETIRTFLAVSALALGLSLPAHATRTHVAASTKPLRSQATRSSAGQLLTSAVHCINAGQRQDAAVLYYLGLARMGVLADLDRDNAQAYRSEVNNYQIYLARRISDWGTQDIARWVDAIGQAKHQDLALPFAEADAILGTDPTSSQRVDRVRRRHNQRLQQTADALLASAHDIYARRGRSA